MRFGGAAVLIILLVCVPSAANAQAGAQLDSDSLFASADSSAAGVRRQPVSARPVPTRSVVYPYSYERIDDLLLSQSCGTDMIIGYVGVYTVVSEGAVPRLDRSLQRCVPAPWAQSAAPGQAAVAPVTLDPLVVQQLVRERLPRPETRVNPPAKGLTGLDTWLWAATDQGLAAIDHDGDAATPARQGVTVTATAGPFSVTARAWVSEYSWDLGGARYTSSTPGSPEEPAATHLFRTKGEYEVNASQTWRGSYTWTGPGGTGSGDLEPVTLDAAPLPYPVIEVTAEPVAARP